MYHFYLFEKLIRIQIPNYPKQHPRQFICLSMKLSEFLVGMVSSFKNQKPQHIQMLSRVK